MSLTRNAELVHVRTHHALTGVPALYRRGSSSVSLSVSPLSVAVTVEQSEGVRVRQSVPHFLILPDTLRIDGQPVEPRLGDQIVQGTQVYEVRGAGSVPVWDWETTSQLRFKVRTEAV